MGGGYLLNAGVFLIQVIFGLYIMAIILRFILQQVRADFYNPVSQFLVKVTNPVLKPLRRFIPGYFGIDWPSILLALALQAVEIVLITAIVSGKVPAPLGLLVLSFAKLLQTVIYIFIVVILIQVVISWINPGSYNPMTTLLYKISEPIMRHARRVVPPMGGFDLSPLVALIVLQLCLMLIVAPIMDIGSSLAGVGFRF